MKLTIKKENNRTLLDDLQYIPGLLLHDNVYKNTTDNKLYLVVPFTLHQPMIETPSAFDYKFMFTLVCLPHGKTEDTCCITTVPKRPVEIINALCWAKNFVYVGELKIESEE